MNTKVVRMALVDAQPLEQRLAALCDVYLAVSFRLVSTVVVGTDLVLVFQKDFVSAGTL